MAINQNLITKKWNVTVCRRHPLTRKPMTRAKVGIPTNAKAKQLEKELYEKLGSDFKKLIIPSWGKCVDEFIEDFSKRDISLKSVETYRLCLRKHTNKIWQERLVTDINEHEVRKFIISLEGVVSPSHQKNMLKYIKAVMDYACSQKYIAYPAYPKKMKFKLGDKLKGTLTESQAKFFLLKAKEQGVEWYEIWAMALYTGMRNGELFALTWDKVDLENKRIKIDTSWTAHTGFKSTKSGDDRWIEIAQGLHKILIELKQKNQNSQFVLPRIEAWTKGEQARVLRMFLESIGLPRIRFHDLRATIATIMLNKGVEQIKVKKFFGWKDLKTMEHYVRNSAVEITGITKNISFMTEI